VDGLWATKSEGVGLIVRAISFQNFQPICDHSLSTNVTDRKTDDMQSQDRALHYSASRGKNTTETRNTPVIIMHDLRKIRVRDCSDGDMSASA